MAKIEIVRHKDHFRGPEYWAVQATYREPFEHFFEIAIHFARFEDKADAERLADRVRAACKENGLARSMSFVIKTDYWKYKSSAYNGKMAEKCHDPQVYPFPF